MPSSPYLRRPDSEHTSTAAGLCDDHHHRVSWESATGFRAASHCPKPEEFAFKHHNTTSDDHIYSYCAYYNTGGSESVLESIKSTQHHDAARRECSQHNKDRYETKVLCFIDE